MSGCDGSGSTEVSYGTVTTNAGETLSVVSSYAFDVVNDVLMTLAA